MKKIIANNNQIKEIAQNSVFHKFIINNNSKGEIYYEQERNCKSKSDERAG